MSMRDETRSTIQTQRQYEHDVQQDDDNKDCIRLQNQICSIWISATRPSYGGQSALAVPTTVPGALHSLCFISYSLCLLECTLLAAMWSLQAVDRMICNSCLKTTVHIIHRHINFCQHTNADTAHFSTHQSHLAKDDSHLLCWWFVASLLWSRCCRGRMTSCWLRSVSSVSWLEIVSTTFSQMSKSLTSTKVTTQKEKICLFVDRQNFFT